MKKDVLIHITGLYDGPEAQDSMELTTIGSFTHMPKTDSYYITYRESEATGMDGTITTVKVEGDKRVTLIRRGGSKSRLILERGRRHLCYYDTGFGDLMVGIFADLIRCNLQEDGGEVSFRYTLDINSGFASRNEVNITVREAGTQICQK